MPTFRRSVPGVAALVTLTLLYVVTAVSAANPDPETVKREYGFERMDIPMPPGYDSVPKKNIREVNPSYEHVRAWISSVGASIALNDLTGSGRESGICLVDSRTDSVVVTHAPTAPPQDRFTPFTLTPDGLSKAPTSAPMGCTPGDYNSDGRMDLLVYYWGRTPVIFQGSKDAGVPTADSYRPVEMLPTYTPDGSYTGQPWNTNAVLVNDLNGDGHVDVVVGNYFPQSGVLDTEGRLDVYMNDSLSRATNGGGVRVMRWVRNDDSGRPVFVEDKAAVPYENASGWTLGLAGGDLTSDLLPEMYIANDFGHDHLLFNRSTEDRIRFTAAVSSRGPTTPKSFQIGKDSFKGMGADFVDLDGRGKFDMLVSNITSAWGLEESNFVWRNDAASAAEMRRELAEDRAPFTQQAQERGMAWTGWGWDIKAADFTNSGYPDVIQAAGFVRGDHNRWAWLQELATSNDVLVREPSMWPNMKPGDDIAGRQSLAFYARNDDDRFANLAEEIGADITTPSRGIAIADTSGSGMLDFAVAYQYAAPVFFKNTSEVGAGLDLRLLRPADDGSARSTPAYGATVTIRRADGSEQRGQLDGGSGHSGKRGFRVHFGLGKESGAVNATLRWLDSEGNRHSQSLQLEPGRRTIMLTDQAKEISR